MLAGIVSEEVRFGVTMLRVDIPAINEGDEPATKYFSGGALYCVTPCTEQVARAILKRENPKPVHIWGCNLVPKALPEAKAEVEELTEVCPYCNHSVPVSHDTCSQCGAFVERDDDCE